MRATLALVLFVLSIYVGRLIQLQGVDASALATRAFDERSTTVALPAHRGDITDVNGAVLATTVDRWNILVDQREVVDYTKRIGGHAVRVGVVGAAADLAPVLGMDKATLRAALTGTRRGAYVAKGVPVGVWRKVARMMITGIAGEQDSRRIYPDGAVGASLVGFVSRDGRPLAGIEKEYASFLAGRDGKLQYEMSGDGARVAIPTGLENEVEPQPGGNVRLTIDADLQWKAHEALAAEVTKSGAESGSVVVLDTRTFDILALASVPTLDSNDPGAAPAADRGNRSLLDVFEPGSTSKLITASAAVQEGVATPATRLRVPNSIHRGGRTFHDSEAHATENLTFAGVLAKSSNVGSIMVGERISPQTMYHYLTAFGLGAPTGLGLPESRGILAPVQDWSRSQRYTVLFGQGMSLTALQDADVYATIANNGVRLTPRIVAGTTTPDGQFHPTPTPPSTRVVSAQTAATVRYMLESVVSDEGTAAGAAIPGYRVAGKTGTAQAPDARCGCYRGYTASFIGMAPADDPHLVVAVILQRPVRGHYGSLVAAPVFQQVMTYALAHEGIPPTGAQAPVVPVTYP